jgi:hypothetical protein
MALPLAFPYSKSFSAFTLGGGEDRRGSGLVLGCARQSVRHRTVNTTMEAKIAFTQGILPSPWSLRQPGVEMDWAKGRALVAVPQLRTMTLHVALADRDYEIGDIAEGNDKASGLRREIVANPAVIGENQKVHGCEPCQLSSNACRICAMAVFTLHRNWFA